MKHLFFLVLAISLSVTACKKDKDTDSIQLTSENVLGTWNLNTGSLNGKIGFGIQGQFAYTDIDANLSNIAVTATFNADGTWTSMGTATATIVTKEQGEASETETEQLTNGIGSGTYTVTNGKLTLNGLNLSNDPFEEEDPITFDVTSFTPDAKLDLFNYTKTQETDPVFGFDVSQEITTIFKFNQ
jgi:hypothetical protein